MRARRGPRADAARDRRGAVRAAGRDGRAPANDAGAACARCPARGARAPGPVRGTAARDVRRTDDARARPRCKLLVLDLHAVRDSPAVGILMACATAWMSALLSRMAERPGRERLINVADESWKIIQHTGLGEWFQSNFKLARQFGVMNLVVMHKLGDLQAAGDAGSRAAGSPKGSIADASTRIIYHQDEGQIAVTRALLGLSRNRGEIADDALAPARRSGASVRDRSSCSTTGRGSRHGSRDTDTGMRIDSDKRIEPASSRPGFGMNRPRTGTGGDVALIARSPGSPRSRCSRGPGVASRASCSGGGGPHERRRAVRCRAAPARTSCRSVHGVAWA